MEEVKKTVKIKQPVSKGVAKVPVIMQMEELECGAASLDMILAYYERFVPLSVLRKECGISRDGSNAKSLCMAARKYGLEAGGYRFSTERIKRDATFPCILFWNFSHFVVLDGIKDGKFMINDPGMGFVKMDERSFMENYSNICIMFKPGENFVPGGQKQSLFRYTGKLLNGSGSMIAMVILTTTLMTAMAMIEPAFSRIFVDNVLVDNASVLWVKVFFFGFIGISFIRLAALWIRSAYLLKIQGKMAITANTKYMWHVLRLPMEFFSQRSTGDLINRKNANEMIASTMISQYAPLVLDIAAMLFYLGMMIFYSPLLAAIGVFSVILNIFVTMYVTKEMININRLQAKNESELLTDTMIGIRMIETIKSAGVEDGYFEKWAGSSAECNNDAARMAKLSAFMGQLPGVITAITTDVILCMGVGFIINGDWTMGIVSAFMGYLNAFTAPADAVVTAAESFEEMSIDVDRIEDVMEYGTDIKPVTEEFDDSDEYEKLKGDIEFRDVSFGYNPLKPALINNFNMKVERGKSVAFVGGSGSGKSTIAKVLAGLYKPWSGEVLIDGIPLDEIKRSVLTSSLSSVDQDISLFGDTISNNIKMWDNSIEDFEVIMAAHDAKIHEDIMQRDTGYATKLIDGGKNLSGGQCQRIEIARALAVQPSIIILDEATSALDAETEHYIMDSIRKQGITMVIISHRLSTIRDCDEIIVLKGGAVIDRGRHEELMQRCEYYQTMITNE